MRTWLWFFLLFTAVGWAAEPVDLLLSKPWVVDRQPALSLGMSPAEVGCSPSEEMTILADGLAVRFRGGHVVDLTTTTHRILLGGQLVCQPGDSQASLEARLGRPAARYTKPSFINVEMFYYRGAMADLGALVQEGKLQSVLLTEPGMLEPTLLVAGYQRLP